MDCKRVTVIRIGPVISTKKALYFVGSMVIFFFLQTQKKAGASHKRESHRLC